MFHETSCSNNKRMYTYTYSTVWTAKPWKRYKYMYNIAPHKSYQAQSIVSGSLAHVHDIVYLPSEKDVA